MIKLKHDKIYAEKFYHAADRVQICPLKVLGPSEGPPSSLVLFRGPFEFDIWPPSAAFTPYLLLKRLLAAKAAICFLTTLQLKLN